MVFPTFSHFQFRNLNFSLYMMMMMMVMFMMKPIMIVMMIKKLAFFNRLK